MIICPNCKEEIDDGSHYCDQCGQALLYCNRCGRVGMGRRCTSCGGLMASPDEHQQTTGTQTAFSSLMGVSNSVSYADSRQGGGEISNISAAPGVPTLLLYNGSLNIRIQGINGAVIGRRQGPYVPFFQNNRYVSGVHAQLKYQAGTGWSITDKHSSNGTKLNDHALQPDVEMSIKNGDIITIANVNLQVSIN
jgi:hypothetical protein